MGKSTRAPREAPPPGKFGRTRSGSPFRPILQRERSPRGEKLYRLFWLDYEVKGTGTFTMEQLSEAGVRWLKRAPRS